MAELSLLRSGTLLEGKLLHPNTQTDQSEVVQYELPGIPLYVRDSYLSELQGYRALCHWHEDFEFIHAFEGSMDYQVGDRMLVIREGDGLLVMPRRMHFGSSSSFSECYYSCILFHPSLMESCRKMFSRYFAPMLEEQNLDFLYLDAHNERDRRVLAGYDRILKLKKEGKIGYELKAIGCLMEIWPEVYALYCERNTKSREDEDHEKKSYKMMVAYIYAHFQEKLFLQQVAEVGGVSVGQCNRMFKKYAGMTFVEFLTQYRLKYSQTLLLESSLSITEIGYACGFNSSSYYTAEFREQYGCTPSEFRRMKHR